MPPLCFHLVVAKEAADRSYRRVLRRNLGGYLVGATLPDVHLMSGASREETHFFDLKKAAPESGVRRLFQAHPGLAKGVGLGQATRALVAGYLSHLVVDELWILDIYRPFFGPASPLAGDPLANVLDRALQYELDRRERVDQANMSQICLIIQGWDGQAAIGFISAEALERWQGFVCSMAGRPLSWQRFRSIAPRYLNPGHTVGPEELERFLSSVPEVVEGLIQRITPQRLGAFKDEAISRSMVTAEEYLN